MTDDKRTPYPVYVAKRKNNKGYVLANYTWLQLKSWKCNLVLTPSWIILLNVCSNFFFKRYDCNISIIPMNRSRRSPFSLRAGIPPGLWWNNLKQNINVVLNAHHTNFQLTVHRPECQLVHYQLECSPLQLNVPLVFVDLSICCGSVRSQHHVRVPFLLDFVRGQ